MIAVAGWHWTWRLPLEGWRGRGGEGEGADIKSNNRWGTKVPTENGCLVSDASFP